MSLALFLRIRKTLFAFVGTIIFALPNPAFAQQSLTIEQAQKQLLERISVRMSKGGYANFQQVKGFSTTVLENAKSICIAKSNLPESTFSRDDFIRTSEASYAALAEKNKAARASKSVFSYFLRQLVDEVWSDNTYCSAFASSSLVLTATHRRFFQSLQSGLAAKGYRLPEDDQFIRTLVVPSEQICKFAGSEAVNVSDVRLTLQATMRQLFPDVALQQLLTDQMLKAINEHLCPGRLVQGS